MRRAVTAISFILSGTAVLIFILALVTPLLKESSLLVEKGEIDSYGSSVSVVKAGEQLEPKYSQAVNVSNQLPIPAKPLQPAPAQKQSKGLSISTQPADSNSLTSVEPDNTAMGLDKNKVTAKESLKTFPETAVSQIKKKPIRQDKAIGVMKSSSSQNKPMSLAVLGAGMFPPGEVTPRADARKAIDKIIPIIKSRPHDKVVVEGHVDNGLPVRVNPNQAAKLNKVISYLRAIEVAKMLKQKGVAGDRIIVKGLGDTVPAASNRTSEGRAKNRRVEIKLSPD